MRIDSTALSNLVATAGELTGRQSSIAAQISSGNRLSALADDPAAVARSGALADALARTDSFLGSASTVENRLQATDAALGSVVTQLTSAISTAIAGQDATPSPAQRNSTAQTLAAARESLLSLANSSYAGTYLFAGTSNAGPPFTEAVDGTVAYTGDNVTRQLALLSGGSIPTNLPGSQIFKNGSGSVFDALDSLIADLQGGGTADPAAAVSQLRDALDAVTGQRQKLDGSLARVQNETDFRTAQKASLQTEQTTLLGADTVGLATELSATETQRSALLSTIAVVEKGSIFDYLR